jgi:hypothetical protein
MNHASPTPTLFYFAFWPLPFFSRWSPSTPKSPPGFAAFSYGHTAPTREPHCSSDLYTYTSGITTASAAHHPACAGPWRTSWLCPFGHGTPPSPTPAPGPPLSCAATLLPLTALTKLESSDPPSVAASYERRPTSSHNRRPSCMLSTPQPASLYDWGCPSSPWSATTWGLYT